MNRIDRLFGILMLLQSKKYVPAEKIGEKYGISTRTVYRDIKALCEQGVPVSFEQYKGYFIVQGYFIPPVSFTSEEASALLLMQALVDGFADNSIRTHYGTALNKVRSVLRSSQKDHISQLDNNIMSQVPPCFRNNSDFLTLLQAAISSQFIVELQYKKIDGVISQREVEPIGLVFYALSWHLIAWCHMRRDYRDFKLPRIIGVVNTGRPFCKKEHLSLNDYMKALPVSY